MYQQTGGDALVQSVPFQSAGYAANLHPLRGRRFGHAGLPDHDRHFHRGAHPGVAIH
jgi:hypothetical protein